MSLVFQSIRFLFALLLFCFIGLGMSQVMAQSSNISKPKVEVQEMSTNQQKKEIQKRTQPNLERLQHERATLPRREGNCSASPDIPINRKGKTSLSGQTFVAPTPKKTISKEGSKTK